jgi:cytochrome c oxidase assembly protein Cox11
MLSEFFDKFKYCFELQQIKNKQAKNTPVVIYIFKRQNIKNTSLAH